MSAAYEPKDLAISAALAGKWKEAVSHNLHLLKVEPDNVDALNRLAYAYLKQGMLPQSKKVFTKVLKLDPYNAIAIKNNKLIETVKKKKVAANAVIAASPGAFLEDPGKTKIVPCVNVAPATTLTTLSPGQMVTLKAKRHAVEIRAAGNTYLAALPDDVSFKLLKLLAAGNTYQVVVKGVSKNSLTVILRELSRGKRFASQPSFISSVTSSYTPFAPAETKSEEKPSVTATGEDDLEEEEKTDEKPPDEDAV